MKISPFVLLLALFLITPFAMGQDVHPSPRVLTSVLSVPTAVQDVETEDRTLIFEDDFERSESQETKDEVGNGWRTNSESRAAGNKQVDLRDGAMHIYIHEVADHGVSVVHEAEFKDGCVEAKFMLENEDDTLGLNFADLKFKEVHAGHLFKVTIGIKQTELADLKTGRMDQVIRTAAKAKTLSEEQKKLLKTKTKRFKHKLEIGKWYTAVATVKGETLSVSIDGEEVGSFSSPGIAHPTKRMLRLAIKKNVAIDDLKIYSFAESDNANDGAASSGDTPLKVLLIAGGCCHDYGKQSETLKAGIEARISADVTVIYNANNRTDTRFEIYESDDWAKGYDVVLHDECCADVTDGEYVKKILAAHKDGVPAVNLHCAMHSYRWGNFRQPVEIDADNAGWYEMLGIQSSGHGAHSPIELTYVDAKDPIAVGLEGWTTVDEELYNNVRVHSGVKVVAKGKQFQKPSKRALRKDPNAQPQDMEAVIAWTNEYGPKKTKIFSTSLGHYNETVADERYLELVVRGLLWTTGNLTADGRPTAAVRRK